MGSHSNPKPFSVTMVTFVKKEMHRFLPKNGISQITTAPYKTQLDSNMNAPHSCLLCTNLVLHTLQHSHRNRRAICHVTVSEEPGGGASQRGSISLTRSPHLPALPGIDEQKQDGNSPGVCWLARSCKQRLGRIML